MAEYIKREDAINICTKCVAFQDSIGNINASAEAGRIRRLIKELPSANVVERKHGEWKKHKVNPAAVNFKCSICGSTSVLGIENFCPNCGADMRGEGEDG